MTEKQPLNIAIETDNLCKVYGSGNTEVVAMKNVSMKVYNGEVVALLGPSGSGKSTLLTSIGLINLPTSGRIFINNKLIVEGEKSQLDLRTFRRENIGFIFQKSNLIPFLTASENIQIAMQINAINAKESKFRAHELLNYFGIGNRSDSLPSMLSGGQQQRVAIARALANKPSIILADEPTAALDSQRGRQVMELFAKVAHEQNAGVLVVTHDHRALDVFDRTYNMEDGSIS